MTETEARLFVKRLEELCIEFEKTCDCRIDLQVVEKRVGAKKLKWLTVEGISLKIDR